MAVFLLIVYFDARRLGHLNNGDTNALVTGTHVALGCIESGQLSGCGAAVGPYPLLQYLPSAVMIKSGLTDTEVITGLGTISFFALICLLAMTLVVFRRRPAAGALLVLMFVASSMLYHSTSGFGEALTAALVGAAVLAAISKRPSLMFVLIVAASLGKETLAPFVAALALLCARSSDDGWLPPRKLSLAAVGGACVGIGVSFGFNVFRFGTVRNLTYLDPIQHTPGLARKFEFFGAIFASPSAGIIWFWPVFITVMACGAIVGVKGLVRRPLNAPAALSVLAVIVLLVGWVALLSNWYAPFGWITYGPRLAVPLLTGIGIAVVHLAGDAIVRLIQRKRVAFAAVALSLFFGCIQFGSPWRYSLAIDQLIVPTGPCPTTGVSIQSDADLYYRCVSEVMWRRSPLVLDEVIDLSASVAGLAWLLAVAGSIMLFWFVSDRDEFEEIQDGSARSRSGNCDQLAESLNSR